MKFGVVLVVGAQQAILQILAKSSIDDFLDGLELDSGAVKETWQLADCEQVREFPVYDVVAQRDETGVVFRKANQFARSRFSLSRQRLLLAAAASALAGGAITALIRKSRK